MRGAALPRDRSQLRTSSRKETIGGCKLKWNLDNVVVIDVECTKFPDVIIVDEPEPRQEKLHVSNASRGDQRVPFDGVISIDDEDEDAGPSGTGVGRTGSDSSATSSKQSDCASVSSVGDDVSTLPDSSKQKQAYSAKVPVRSRYGFDAESESGSSDSDCSDCELIDSSFDEVRELWEKASHNRRNGSHKARSGQVDQPSSSGHYNDIGGENGTKQHQQTPDFSGSINEELERTKQSTIFGTSESNLAQTASPSRSESPKKSADNTDHESDRCDPTEKGQPIFFRTNGSNLSGTASKSRMGTPFVQSDHNVEQKNKLDELWGKADIYPRNGAYKTRPGPANGPESSMSRMSEVGNENGRFIEKEKPSHAEDGDAVLSFHKDIINERERLKETDEYKRAIEEEWASRQQQLQIQAKESRRLKKRKKAETLRLLDMEKRQKQRVEEVRETQKKDEEHMNLKEQLQVEIRKELSRLEGTCKSMASLLRGLGIPIDGSLQPASNEVHAAYKRALLKFHPDRASRMDIRQQVEAEEKFKLISRMKEKFLS